MSGRPSWRRQQVYGSHELAGADAAPEGWMHGDGESGAGQSVKLRDSWGDMRERRTRHAFLTDKEVRRDIGANTGVSPLRRQSAPPSVEMTAVRWEWIGRSFKARLDPKRKSYRDQLLGIFGLCFGRNFSCHRSDLCEAENPVANTGLAQFRRYD